MRQLGLFSFNRRKLIGDVNAVCDCIMGVKGIEKMEPQVFWWCTVVEQVTKDTSWNMGNYCYT